MEKCFLVFLLCYCCQPALTQPTHLSGRITEAVSGEPLIQAGVFLYQDSSLLAETQTDTEGNYNFTVLTPGIYNVEARYLGFSRQRVTGIKAFAGKANKLDIELSAESIILNEVVVAEYRVPLIEQDNTTSGGVITSDQIKNLPTRNINGLAANTAGLSSAKEGAQIHVRGSRTAASDYHIDGARIPGGGTVSGGTQEAYYPIAENAFITSRQQPLSTFAIDVDRASYSNVRRYLDAGQMPPRDAVRTEELINYFAYDDPEPMGEHPFSVTTELADCPWRPGNWLLRIGLKGRLDDPAEAPPSNLVFLIDVSGSMNAANKLPLLQESLSLLVEQLRPQDRVAIVVYAGAAGAVLPSTPGNDKAAILGALRKLKAGGSTAGSAGIELAYQLAQENLLHEGNNRVILATDGDFNVGISSREALESLITEKRKSGIYLSVLGFGMGNFKDARLELLADKGNGNYAYIDHIGEAEKLFLTEFSGTLYTIAEDVKLQLEFKPEHIQSYRLIGYENRLLAREDFEDDTKDAGELGAGHTVTALYELVPAAVEAIESPILAHLRYKLPGEEQSHYLKREVSGAVASFPSASSDFRFAAAVAAFGQLLRRSEHLGTFTYDEAIALAEGSLRPDADDNRRQFIELLLAARQIQQLAAQK